jgi:hypothetical protein
MVKNKNGGGGHGGGHADRRHNHTGDRDGSSVARRGLSAEDCTPEFWRQLHQSPLFNNPAVVKGLAAALGPLRTVTLVERTEIHGRPNYLYRMKYQKMNVLFLIVFDGDKIAFAKGYPEPK